MIDVLLKDYAGTNAFPDRTRISCVSVPRVGETITLHELLSDSERQAGWYFSVIDVEWSMEEEDSYAPVVSIRRKKS